MATSDSPLSVPNVTLTVARGASNPPPSGDSFTGDIVTDGFETGDFSAPGYPDFSWQGQNKTSIVSMDADTSWCAYTGPVATYNNAEICNPDDDQTKDWNAKNGKYSLRVRYSAVPLGNRDSLAEQRFTITRPDVKEIWMGFWLRIPTNFEHRIVDNPNHKLFRLWQTDKSANETGMEFRPYSDGSGSYMYIDGSGNESTDPEFAIVPRDLGRWQHIIYNLKCETSPGAADGHRKCWRRWEDEAEHTLVLTSINPDYPDEGGFTEGYLMGSSNPGYAQETEYLIDDFVLSTEALI